MMDYLTYFVIAFWFGAILLSGGFWIRRRLTASAKRRRTLIELQQLLDEQQALWAAGAPRNYGPMIDAARQLMMQGRYSEAMLILSAIDVPTHKLWGAAHLSHRVSKH